MTAAEDDRTIRHQGTDPVTVYAYLSAIAAAQDKQSARLDEIAGVAVQHTATLAGLVGMQAQHNAVLAEHGAKIDRILELLEKR
ncbi:MAG TPA: hypothetical protein VKZ81_00715 [Pseudonocardia sp.]|jgi:hypothetical protein|uniref:hypothetical protein n=1 Tax=Pseudonocardia sp. TaxID=60912 RepID=UPI002B4B144C|nr:hypothetical protein [Pseudonocardia sp.]HLU53955.1 hypothetical protein [Pseudonocardia sp.]